MREIEEIIEEYMGRMKDPDEIEIEGLAGVVDDYYLKKIKPLKEALLDCEELKEVGFNSMYEKYMLGAIKTTIENFKEEEQ